MPRAVVVSIFHSSFFFKKKLFVVVALFCENGGGHICKILRGSRKGTKEKEIENSLEDTVLISIHLSKSNSS